MKFLINASEPCKSNILDTQQKSPKMSLKQQVRDWLLRKVFRDPGRPKAKKALAAGSNPFAWSVLVLDSTTLRIVQSCFQGYELTAENVARIDSVADDKRIPTALHAIYFLAPVSTKPPS